MPTHLSKQWIAPQALPSEADQALGNFSPILRQILYNRGYATFESAQQYLNALPPEDSQPNKMLGIPAAVERIGYAISHDEPIAVYGDYDADGVTATALLTDVLRRLGGNARGHIPNRFEEGYGLNIEALDLLAADGIKLVITVDCGVRSIDEAEYARKIGLDLIITDHHHPGDSLPPAIALIDPKQPGDLYPDKYLAGVGLAFKLACALLEKTGASQPAGPYTSPAVEYLDLVALGTVADQVPLKDENRSLVRTGLEYIRRPQRQGIMSLIGVAQINRESINADSIGFGLGPRLNAAGRLDSALAALNLLLTQDVQEAGRLAQQLERQNRERQEITRAIQADAEETALLADPNAFLLFAASAEYSPGVIGLAAARLMEKYYRPAVVAAQGEEFTRASCRSIPEFHITHALDQCADLMIRHGGHAAAAGFTVRNSNLPELIQRLQAIALEELGGLDLRPRARADMDVKLSDLTPQLLKDLAYLEPTGSGNPAATFISRGVRVKSSRMIGKDSSHLKLVVTDDRFTYDAIAFRQGFLQPDLPQFLDLLFTFELNRFNGNEALQLNVKDIQPAGKQ